MGPTSLLTVLAITLLVFAHTSSAAEIGDVFGKRDDMAALEEIRNLRGLRDEAEDVEKRGLFDCVRIFQRCNLRLHCCGDKLKCERRKWYSTSGRCVYKRQ